MKIECWYVVLHLQQVTYTAETNICVLSIVQVCRQVKVQYDYQPLTDN